MNAGINILIDALRSTKNITCIKVPDMLEVALVSNRDTDPHMRNSGLDVADAVIQVAAAPVCGGIDLRSFSMG